MPGWQIALSVDRGGDPLVVQIARAITADIARGRLRPGDPLPGSRSLADTLGVHRNTVLAAYAELEAEGWLTSSRARATYVSRELPVRAPRSFAAGRDAVPDRVGYDLGPALELFRPAREYPPGMLALAGGIPDVTLVPTAAMARAHRRALRAPGQRLLGYGETRGQLRLRAALAEMLSATRGLAAAPETVLVTRGSQMALYLVARALVAPGDLVAVEAPGYRPAWEAFKLAGARLVPLPVDGGGVSVDALAALLEQGPVRAIYLTPHHQYPTTVTLAAGRRVRLLELAARARTAVVEDDYDHEFHYEGRPVLPLASVDRAGTVIYVGTLSKVLAPGLRLGYVVAPEPLLDRLTALRSFVDLQGDHVMEATVAELFEDGEVQRHVRRARRIYRDRRDALADAVTRQLGGALSFERPSGGMALWVRVARGIDVDAWAAAAMREGVAFQTARRFSFDGRPGPHARLGFAAHDEAALVDAVRRMARALTHKNR